MDIYLRVPPRIPLCYLSLFVVIVTVSVIPATPIVAVAAVRSSLAIAYRLAVARNTRTLKGGIEALNVTLPCAVVKSTDRCSQVSVTC